MSLPAYSVTTTILAGAASPNTTLVQWGDGTGWKFVFQGNSARTSNVLTLVDNGNVGINCNAPARTLDVAGTGIISSNVAAGTSLEMLSLRNLSNVDNGILRLGFNAAAGVVAMIDGIVNSATTSSGALSFKTYSGSVTAEGLNISSTQQIKISAYTTNGAVSTTLTNGTLSVSSDRRIKTNIHYMGDEDATSKILALKPARFELVADPSNTQLGFIAQDVETVIPEAVDGKKYEYEWKRDESGNPVVDSNGQLIMTDTPRYRGFSDRPVLATLVKAFQELSARLSNVEARLNAS